MSNKTLVKNKVYQNKTFSNEGTNSVSPTQSKQANDRLKNLLNPDRPFACNELNCGKRFNRRFTLSEHMKTHTGARPYVCAEPGCGKKFSTSGNLARHKRMHTGAKPFECPVEGCEKKFASNGKLSRHLQTHTGARPFECSIVECGKKFSTQGNLTRHMKTHGIYSPSETGPEMTYNIDIKTSNKKEKKHLNNMNDGNNKQKEKNKLNIHKVPRSYKKKSLLGGIFNQDMNNMISAQQKFFFQQMPTSHLLPSPRISLLSQRRSLLFDGQYDHVELDPLPFSSLFSPPSKNRKFNDLSM